MTVCMYLREEDENRSMSDIAAATVHVLWLLRAGKHLNPDDETGWSVGECSTDEAEPSTFLSTPRHL